MKLENSIINYMDQILMNSHAHFTVIKNNEKKNYRIWTNAIKNIGENSILDIINERKKNGKFKNFRFTQKNIQQRVK